MARHILQGERPVFFYGQAYMGSLDAWLIAVGFQVLGASVLTIRIVEAILYLLIVATGFAVAWRVSDRVVVAVVAALVIAVPDVLLAIYSTATLGGYNETLLLGNLLLLLGWDITHEHRGSLGRWALLGLVAGIGWWTNGLIIAYALPVGGLILWDMWRNIRKATPPPTPPRIQGGESTDRAVFAPSPEVEGSGLARLYLLPILIALLFFLIGSAPWWAFNLQYDWAALRFYLPSNAPSQFAGTDIAPLSADQRLIGLFLLGLPAVIGLRFPWSPSFFLPIFGLAVLLIYALALYRFLRKESLLKPDGRLLIGGMIAWFCALFVVSRFSLDPTGRYFLPLILPLGIGLGALIAAIRLRWLRIALVAVVIGYNVAGMAIAMSNTPPGLTTIQLYTHLPNSDDDALIGFLEQHGLTHGYTNYWIWFRLAFLSADRLEYSAVLPYKPDFELYAVR